TYDGLTVVPITEHSDAFDLALRYIYPLQTPRPVIREKEQIAFMLSIHHKYDVRVVHDAGKDVLKALILQEAIFAFHIAMDFEEDELARLAAQHVLHLPLYDLHSFPLLSSHPQHLCLQEYHLRCGAAASHAILSPEWLQTVSRLVFRGHPSQGFCHACISPHPNWLKTSPVHTHWWGKTQLWVIVGEVGKSLRMHPSLEHLELPKERMGLCCSQCHEDTLIDFPEVWKTLFHTAMRAIESVALPVNSSVQLNFDSTAAFSPSGDMPSDEDPGSDSDGTLGFTTTPDARSQRFATASPDSFMSFTYF
ncbi:hypothetical protein OF83DRAFT_1089626, partial [Amylostereum chailletii]